MASPLDRMIDQACGIQPGAFVTMRCPTCRKGPLLSRPIAPAAPELATKTTQFSISARTGRSSVSKAKQQHQTAHEFLYGATAWRQGHGRGGLRVLSDRDRKRLPRR